MTTEMERLSLASGAVEELRESLRGDALVPGDAGYDEARVLWNASHDLRPALIVRCRGAADVIRALELARSEGLEVAVRAGGHSIPGFSGVDGGIVIDLSRMRGVRIDPATRRAVVEAGCTWADLDREAQAFGLATTGGLVSSTGVAGFTLGGGIGHLMRKHGLACDNLVGADVVTADGRQVRAGADGDPELLWGLRGGGGNFGVVTSMEFELHPVGPTVFGGAVFFAGEHAGALLHALREQTPSAPDELTLVANLTIAPPVPFLPAEVHGKPIAALLGAYSGAHDEGARAMAPLKAVAPPVADLFGPIPYLALQSLIDPLWTKGARNHFRAGYLTGLDDGTIETLFAAHATQPGPLGEIHVHQFGGAVGRVGEEDSAFGDRSAPYVLNVIGRWEDPRLDEPQRDWSTHLFRRLGDALTGRAYSNFVGDAGADPAAIYGGGNYARLQALKDRYDPENVFHRNQNIPPSRMASRI